MEKKKLIILLSAISIVVVCGIACVMFFLTAGVLGVKTTEKASRDNFRRNLLSEMNLQLLSLAHSNRNKNLPDSIEVQNDSFLIDGKEIEISRDYLKPGTGKSNSKETVYCYKKITQSKFALGVQLENGDWYNIMVDECNETDRILP